MHAAFSVIAFTVLSGAGLGALAIVAIADLGAAAALWPALAPRETLAFAAGVGLALLVGGLCSSTLHLANPRNAWRSASRFRSSWLSREAVFALVLLPVAAMLVVSLALGFRPRLLAAWSIATVLLAWTVLVCTAMIYASLKPIRQWHTARVPIAYFLLGHASGAVVVEAIVRPAAGTTPLAMAGVVLLVVALLVKEEYWRFTGSEAGSLTMAQAIGVPHGVAPPGATSVMAARLLDAGHSRGTFLTREFVNADPGRRRNHARWAFILGSVFVPVVWLVVGLRDWPGGLAASLSCLGGLLAERWLFFADARHTVRLFHGDSRT